MMPRSPAAACSPAMLLPPPRLQPNEARDLLSGTWRLAYTSNSELLALLALGRLPLVTVGDIIQRIDGEQRGPAICLQMGGARLSISIEMVVGRSCWAGSTGRPGLSLV